MIISIITFKIENIIFFSININKGAPKKSALEQYTPNLIAGFSTAGGIMAFFAFTCAIYKFRYRDPEEEKKRRPNEENGIKMSTISGSNVNDGFVDEDFDDISSVRF